MRNVSRDDGQLRFRVAGDCKTGGEGERLRDVCAYKQFAITLNRRQRQVEA